jgi:hypothetical protein
MSTEEMSTSKQCKAIKENGLRCEARVLSDSECCFFHDPTRAADRKAAQSLGGQGNRMKTLDPGTPDVKIENGRDLLTLLNVTMNQVRTGVIDPRIATTLGYLADITMRAIKQNELEMRIRRLESVSESRVDS